MTPEIVEDAWSGYWAAGHEHSCPTSFLGFYGPETQAFWRRQTEGLQPTDTILDLGCGNGGLLRFIHGNFAAGRAPQLWGVDAAALPAQEARTDESPAWRIHDRVRFSGLPFEEGTVSLLASQFGIEYSNDDASWREAFRVLRDQARCAFILHKVNSKLDAVAADEVVQANSALSGAGVFARAAALLPYMVQARSAAGQRALGVDVSAQAAREQYNAAARTLLDLSGLLNNGQYARDILGAVTGVLSTAATLSLAESQRRLGAAREGVVAHLQRITELRRSALDAGGLEAVRKRLSSHGFVLQETRILCEEGHEMGWTVEGRRDRKS